MVKANLFNPSLCICFSFLWLHIFVSICLFFSFTHCPGILLPRGTGRSQMKVVFAG
uniref:Uncharacterized protein n=1 Tax=Rhizophora mucronata TaxID=61149 RepID=A0A2P2QGT7_RHIMU